MNVGANAFRVGRKEIRFRRLKSGVLNDGLHRQIDVVEFVESVDIGNVARVENVVNVFEKRFAFYLEIDSECEGERCRALLPVCR